MTLSTILKTFNTDISTLTVVLILLTTLVQIAPIKINPWTHLIRWMGKVANEKLMIKMDALETEMADMNSRFSSDINKINITMETQEAMNARQRILRFGNEVKNHEKHTEEHFYEVLQDIDAYEKYCDEHRDFKNNRCNATIKVIKETYDERMKKNDFL